MTLYANTTDTPVVIDADGHVLPGGEKADLTLTTAIAQQLACGRMVDVDALRAEVAPPAETPAKTAAKTKDGA